MAETMTLTKALVELKLLSKRIEKNTQNFDALAIRKGTVEHGKFEASVKSQAEFERKVKANWQATTDLMARRRKIKSALVIANASTQVEVAGERMTIAEAIERKNMMHVDRDIIRHLSYHLSRKQEEVDKHNRGMDERLQRLVETSYGNKEVKVSEEDYERIAKPFRESNEAHLVDPLNCEKVVGEMEERCDAFMADVDVTLSIANARTQIRID